MEITGSCITGLKTIGVQSRMFKAVLLVSSSFLMVLPVLAFQQPPALKELDKAIANKEVYVKKKYKEINGLKKLADRHTYSGKSDELFEVYMELFNEYRSFQYDTAYFYLEKAKSTAYKIKDTAKIYRVKIREGFVLMSSGLFKEALDTLNSVPVDRISTVLKFDYYTVKTRTYYDLADYTGDSRFSIGYIQLGNKLSEKALEFAEPDSQDYWSSVALMYMKQHNWEQARESFLYWMKHYELSPESYAIATSSLAYVYEVTGGDAKSMEYLALAATADTRNAIKETVALRNLAGKLFDKGDLARANRYITLAMEDATFYNARHRKIAISSILPIIEKSQILKTEKQKRNLTIIVVVLSVLAVSVVIFLIIIFRSLRERNASRRILAESNRKLQELNTHLKEADSIKQEYIAYFLKASSDFIRKIDHIQKSTLQKIMAKRPEDVVQSLKKFSVKNEREQLFHQFDEVFLKLFPTFKEEYYKLFPETEETLVKTENTLNTELRIFALYRLGVQDSHQVAEFLELSVSTIYTYKARIKSRSYHKRDFEERIMDIKQL